MGPYQHPQERPSLYIQYSIVNIQYRQHPYLILGFCAIQITYNTYGAGAIECPLEMKSISISLSPFCFVEPDRWEKEQNLTFFLKKLKK